MKLNMTLPIELQIYLYQQMLFKQQLILHDRPGKVSSAGWFPRANPAERPICSEDIKVDLKNKELWQKFCAETTEMIITKLGRQMFPRILLSISGMECNAYYCLLVELVPTYTHRYKFVGTGGEYDGELYTRGWIPAGLAEPQPHVNHRVYLHPDSPATGSHWMNHPINFIKLKLTNNVNEICNNIILTSMHKYIPKIWIVRYDDITRLGTLYSQPAVSIVFEEMHFIAVTAYQNENITQLKIDNNPFAKGFRNTGHSRSKRKLDHLAFNDVYSSYKNIDDNRDEDDNDDDDDDDEEEMNNSSSTESEPSRTSRSRKGQTRRKKKITANANANVTTESCYDNSGNSSSDSFSPSPILSDSRIDDRSTMGKDRHDHCETLQPRFHRPWLDFPASSTIVKPSSLPSSPVPNSVSPSNSHSIVIPPPILWPFSNSLGSNKFDMSWHRNSQ